MRPTLALILPFVAALFVCLTACEPTSGADHYALAKQMEAEIGPPQDYSRPEYEDIALELSLAQSGDPTYGQAQTWLKEIRTARANALFQKDQPPEVQEGGYHPSTDSAAAGGGGGKPRGSMTAAGWMPYNDVSVGVGGGGSASTRTASASRSSAKCNKGPVTLYGTSWCGVCKEARTFFRSNGVAFADKDIEADPSAKAELARKAPGATGVPVIDIGGDIMPGFSASSVKSKMCL